MALETASSAPVGSLRRGMRLLKLLANAGPRGLPLTDIAQRAGLPHPSVHRVLLQLIAEGAVEYCTGPRRYRLGQLIFELGLAGAAVHDIQDLCRDSMKALAEETQDTVYLVTRSGCEAVCATRIEGPSHAKGPALALGSRRPLGVGAGGLAILAALEQGERQEVIRQLTSALRPYPGIDASALHTASAAAQATGMAIIRNTVTLGVTAVGVPLRDGAGRPLGALSVAALSPRMTQSRAEAIGQSLKAAAHLVQRRLGNSLRTAHFASA